LQYLQSRSRRRGDSIYTGDAYTTRKAKAATGYYALYDKVSREDVLANAHARCRSNKGAPGVEISTLRTSKHTGSIVSLRQETYQIWGPCALS
jgi:hypothetical protein